eukprot:CAMPEP_0169141484 /NCGR_PEP_ID=MMETSP1015-20121227/44327_1 /TAXON_ID=342587 /ORGANISM="Karlodinium micrum, Strain CCMP2283" /LENGTH=1261 /DNA_ID=CAMNT_0009207859 /DNA_START=30 /DNA_END=3815 /DNA_ORIENTATION=+
MPFRLGQEAVDFSSISPACTVPTALPCLHAHLLRLPREERKEVIAGLSSPKRAELSAYIQAMQKSIEEGDEPELEPPAQSHREVLPNGRSIQDLFARARLVRERLEVAQESPWNRDENTPTHKSRFESSSSSSCASELDSDIDSPGDSSSDVGNFALRALLRHLTEATPQMRKSMIRSLTRERRIDLFAYMISSEGRTVCGNSFGEEELLDPELENLGSHRLFSTGEFDLDSEYELPSSDELDSDRDSDTKCNSESHPNSPHGKGAALTCSSLPQTPSKQQLVFRPRNARPLGALQLEHLNCRHPTKLKSAGRPLAESHVKKNLNPSGIESSVVLEWLCGHISGPLCLARLLEGMQWARFSYQKDAKTLCSTEDLYSSSIANGYGGTLGGMVGGVSRALATDVETQLGGLFNSKEGPEIGLQEADSWVRACVEDSAPEDGDGNMFQLLEGLAEEDINLTFRRRCIALHPHRNAGHLDEYLKIHVYLEILRQWQEVAENPTLLYEPSLRRDSFGFSDRDLVCELRKDTSTLVEDSKRSNPEDLQLRGSDISSHILQLSWIKEKLEAEVNFMRNQGAYSSLGIGPEVSDAELARAYKAQALRLHPDRGGSTEAFQALQSAYERILKQREGKPKKKPDDKNDNDAKMEPDEGKEKEAAGDDESSLPPTVNVHDNENHGSQASMTSPAKSWKRPAAENESSTPSHDLEGKGLGDRLPSDGEQEAEEEDPPDTESNCVAGKISSGGVTSLAADESCNAERKIPVVCEGDSSRVTRTETEEESNHRGNHRERHESSCENSKTKKAEASSQDKPADNDSCSQSDCDDQESSVGTHIDDLETASVIAEAEDLEKFLTTAAAAIPAENVATQAEMALQSAQMCLRAVRLCARAAEVGPDAWPQLQRLTSHALEASQHIAEACDRIAIYAGSVPNTVMPLLNTVSQHSSRLKDAVVRQVIKGTQSLLSVTENVSSLSKEVCLRQSILVKHATALLEAMQGFITHDVMTASVCESVADVLDTVGRLGREAAESAGAAAMAVNEAQRHAENLVEILGAAGLWQKMHSDKKSDQSKGKSHKKDGAKDSDNDNDDDSSETEKEAWELYVERASLMQKLNCEVVQLQQELRTLVNQDPALIPAVSASQKQHLFAVVAELLAQAHKAVSRVWYEQWVAECPSGTQEVSPVTQDFVKLVENSLGFIFSASSWQQVAVPSIEARLVRLAALLDSQLLCTMLQEDVFKHALELAPTDSEQALKARFATVTQAMRVGFAGG